MNKTISKNIFWAIPVLYLISGFVYILVIIQPELIFHHQQPPFILSPVFYKQYTNYPGGLAELVANLIMQSFYFKIIGHVVLLAIASVIGWLTYGLVNSIIKSKLNSNWAAIPFLLTIILTNNYDFPFSSIVSVAFLLLILLILTKASTGIISSISIYILGSFGVYLFAGSGYLMLFSIAALFISLPIKNWLRGAFTFIVIAVAFLLPLLVSNYLFAVSLKHQYLYFFAPKAWFMSYEPSLIFLVYILSAPVLLILANFAAAFGKRKKTGTTKQSFIIIKTSLVFLIVTVIAFYSHFSTFNSDAKKIVKADYYCYTGNAEGTAKTSTSLRQYNFTANLNYNLVMSKTGKLTENFFSFMQIKGIESLHPDVEFATELSFIAADFYYDLGFISEARHWAYESLVFYPYSFRAMQKLVKIHLVNREYKAAERTLKTLQKGLIDKRFVSKYMRYISDTTLIAFNSELMEKRSYIPVEKELNRNIEGRFIELLEANEDNKRAYEYLMLYYLLDAQLEKFITLYKNASQYFDKIPDVYEEALLMYTVRNEQPLPANIKISTETQNRFNNFMKELERYKGKTRLARNTLYAEYGNTYLYFLKFVYPNIMETEIITDEDDYPEI